LRLKRETNTNPRLIIHGIPCSLTKEDLKFEIISLNLKDVDFPDVKIIYVFSPKDNRRLLSCIIEVSPNIRALLLKDEYIFINYSACKIFDYIRVLQRYHCLVFDHFGFAKQCNFSPVYGHCAGAHKTKNCFSKKNSVCGNCKRWQPQEERSHSALDSKNCYFTKKNFGSSISTMANNQTKNIRICHCQSLFAHIDEFRSFFVNSG